MKQRTLITFSLISIVLLFSSPSHLWAEDEDVIKGLEVKKTPTYDYQKQQGLITLETYVDGKVIREKKNTPADVILVMDVSLSMSYNKNDNATTVDLNTDMGRMKKCATNLIDMLNANSKTTGLEHRVCAITFACTGTLLYDFMPTTDANLSYMKGMINKAVNQSHTLTSHGMNLADKMMAGGKGSTFGFGNDSYLGSWEGYDYSNVSESNRRRQDEYGNYYVYPQFYNYAYYNGTALTSALSAKWNSNTNVYGGGRPNANKYVILLTDGACGEQTSKPTAERDAAIKSAKSLKDNGATIYCVSFIGTEVDADARTSINRMLNGISSNCPNATNYASSTETKAYGFVTEISKSASGGLEAIIESITKEIEKGVAAVELEETVVTDVIDNTYFSLPEGTEADDISVYSLDCTGYDGTNYSSGNKTTLTKTGANPDYTISVTPPDNVQISLKKFDLSENWWGAPKNTLTGNYEPHGKKLVVEIPFVVKSDNATTGILPTNADGSGVTGQDKKLPDTDPNKEINVPFNKPSLPIYKMTITNEGLKAGESAVYYIYDNDNPTVVYCRVVLTGDGSGSVSKTIYYVDGGKYTVKETGWGWTYKENTSITKDTNSTTGTEFKFTSVGKTGTLLDHDEDVELNKFNK